MQGAVHQEHPRPDDLARFGDAVTGCRRPAGRYIGGWRIEYDLSYPPLCEAGTDPEISKTQTNCPSYSSPQRTSCRVVAGSSPIAVQIAVGDQRVEPDALVDLVEVRQRRARVQIALAVPACAPAAGRTLFSSPSARSRPATRSLRPCWYWMPTAVAAEVVGDPQRPRCTSCTAEASARRSVRSASSVPVWNVMPAASSQRSYRLRLVVGHLRHLGVAERRLAESLLVHARSG